MSTDMGFSPGLINRLEKEINSAISHGIAPGMSIAVGRHGKLVLARGYGKLDRNLGKVDLNTIYDLASLTKVVGTITAAMILEEENKLDLNRTVRSYLPQFNSPAKATITINQLLVHRSGLEAYATLFLKNRGRIQYLNAINSRPLVSKPGTVTRYSDWNMILLQLVIEKISGQTLDTFLANRVFRPLGMHSTMFNPRKSLSTAAIAKRIAPTPIPRTRGRKKIRAQVQDDNARAMGGVSGHAGLFSTAADLAIFAQFMLNKGVYNGVRLLKPDTVSRWTAKQDPSSSRALGWDTPSLGSPAGKYFSPQSFGHTGFSGTYIWIDPVKDVFLIILSNCTNPSSSKTHKIETFRRAMANIVQECITDASLISQLRMANVAALHGMER